jgi:hypothetical protein
LRGFALPFVGVWNRRGCVCAAVVGGFKQLPQNRKLVAIARDPLNALLLTSHLLPLGVACSTHQVGLAHALEEGGGTRRRRTRGGGGGGGGGMRRRRRRRRDEEEED